MTVNFRFGFGGFGGGGGREQERRGPEIKMDLEVTLEELFNGEMIDVRIQVLYSFYCFVKLIILFISYAHFHDTKTALIGSQKTKKNQK
jgi:hypothetical protein